MNCLKISENFSRFRGNLPFMFYFFSEALYKRKFSFPPLQKERLIFFMTLGSQNMDKDFTCNLVIHLKHFVCCLWFLSLLLRPLFSNYPGIVKYDKCYLEMLTICLIGINFTWQLRGRVGRADKEAHAHLFYPEKSLLSDQALVSSL